MASNYLSREEDGVSHYLLEDGSGSLLREEPLPVLGTDECAVLLETGDYVLQENGDIVLLELCVPATTATAPRPGARIRREQIRRLQDDDEALLLILTAL